MSFIQRTERKTRIGRATGVRPKNLEVAPTIPLFKTAFAVAAISASGLAYESLLTRMFSLVFQYHFAFVAVSLAVFGLGIGALLAYIFGWTINLQKGQTRLVRLGLATAIALPISTILFSRLIASSVTGITFVICLVPFLCRHVSAVLYAQQSRQGPPFIQLIWAGRKHKQSLGLISYWAPVCLFIWLPGGVGAIVLSHSR
jgi:hypothetical protein